MPEPSLTAAELAGFDEVVRRALAAGDPSQLNVLGFGELSVSLGWPADEPRLVCKRLPPFSRDQLTHYEGVVGHYLKELSGGGLAVANTELMALERPDGRLTAYLIQPLFPAESLGHRVLSSADPDPDHPFLAAVGSSLELVTDQLSLDAQVTNFSWDGTRVTLLDVGTPFVWDRAGALQFDMDPFLVMIPAPLRAFVRRDMSKRIDRWREPRRVALDLVANLFREGMDQWVEPALVALNRVVGGDEPMRVDEARALYDEDLATWPRLKRLQRVERAWQTAVRRRPYDFFIHTTFGEDRTR